MTRVKPAAVLTGTGGLLCACVLFSTCAGAYPIPLADLLGGNLSDRQWAVLSVVRFPRVLLAVLVGAALAVSGAALQGLFRNPLADPGLIGIAGGAALAAGAAIVLFDSFSGALGVYGLGGAAFIGGLLACMAVMGFARFAGEFSIAAMLLAGVAVNAVAMAGVGLLTFLSDDQQLRSLTFWMLGSLGGALWPAVMMVFTAAAPAAILLARRGADLNILLLGDDEARCLGVDPRRVKRIVVFCAALSVGAAVAVSGIIGFVGLVVPHLIRLMTGPDHRLLLPAAALLGGALLSAADAAARLVVVPAEMPVGVLTGLLGGPFFLWLLSGSRVGKTGI